MRASLLPALLLALLSSSAPADPPLCPPCPGGTHEISLLVTTREFQGTWYRRRDNTRTFNHERPEGYPAEEATPTTDALGLRQAILSAASQCKRIRFLLIESHGSEGGILLGRHGEAGGPLARLNVNDIDAVLGGLDCAMAPGARIKMDGCSSGAGCEGEDFMAQIASRLLRAGGGSVVANTTRSSTPYPGIVPRFSLGTQTLTVKPGLADPQWEHAPVPVSECYAQGQSALATLRSIRQTMENCASSDPRLPGVRAGISQLERADATLAPSYFLGGPRPQFTPAYEQVAQYYRAGMTNYRSTTYDRGQLPVCSAPPPPGTFDYSGVPAGVATPH